MTTTLDLLEECRRLLWDRHDDDYAIDLRGRLEEHIARESAQPNSRVVNDPLTTDVARWLAEKRFGPQHIGLGDIRLTIGDQEELLTMIAPTCKPDLHVCQPNPQPAPAVPNGWAMVPVELTEEMIVAAIAARKFAGGKRDLARNVHRAMLAAAPTPPKGE